MPAPENNPAYNLRSGGSIEVTSAIVSTNSSVAVETTNTTAAVSTTPVHTRTTSALRTMMSTHVQASSVPQRQPTPPSQPNQVQPLVFSATALLQPTIYDGSSNPINWTSQFKSWVQLQRLDESSAINALTFYLSGAAKIWYDGLPSSSRDLKAVLKLLEIRFTKSDDDDIMITQKANESVLEFIDRVLVKAAEMKIPEPLMLKLAKKGFHQGLQTFIIQRNPKTMDELREAAIIAEKCAGFKFIATTFSECHITK